MVVIKLGMNMNIVVDSSAEMGKSGYIPMLHRPNNSLTTHNSIPTESLIGHGKCIEWHRMAVLPMCHSMEMLHASEHHLKIVARREYC